LLKKTKKPLYGIHSPFVYNLITLCLRKKYKKDIKFKKYVNGFSKFLNLKSIQILNDLILYLKTENYYCITEEKHSFLLLPSLEKLQKKHPENSDLIYVSENNQNIKLLLDLISNLKQNGLLIIENPYSLFFNNYNYYKYNFRMYTLSNCLLYKICNYRHNSFYFS